MTAAAPLSAAAALDLARDAVALVLDVDPTGLRGDTPLADIGADSLARICLADAVEAAAADRHGVRVRLPERTLAEARTLADLVAPLVGVTPPPPGEEHPA